MKVLIVDDEAIQRMVLADLLSRFERVEIVEAADGDAAWTELQNGLCPVLCLCDMSMPGMTGIELLRHFKSSTILAGVPFIFITAATKRETVQEAIASGATNYILKPFNLPRERAALEKVFRGVRERYSEEPSVTQKRLGISGERLLGYFDAFKHQLVEGRAQILEQLADGGVVMAGAKLDSLRTGCITLGLLHAAAMIDALRDQEPTLVERVLTDVEAMIDEQRHHVAREFGIHETRK